MIIIFLSFLSLIVSHNASCSETAPRAITDIAFSKTSPDVYVAGDRENALYVYNLLLQGVLKKASVHSVAVLKNAYNSSCNIAHHPQLEAFATRACDNNNIQVTARDDQNNQILQLYPEETPYTQLAYTPDGKRLVTGHDRYIKVRATDTGNTTNTIETNADIACMGIYPSSAIIAAGFKKSVPYNEPIVLYDTMAWNRPIMRIESETPPLNLAITDNKLICGTSEDVEIWDIRKTDRKVYDITLSLVSTANNPLKKITIEEIGSNIIINRAPSNTIVKQNIVRTLEQEYAINQIECLKQENSATRVAISTAANEFAVTDGRLVKVYDLTSFNFKRDIRLNNDTITAIAYSKNGELIAVGTDTGKTAAYRVPLKLNISGHTK